MSAAATIDEHEEFTEAARVWWVFLITGSIWILFSIIIFRFDYTTVNSIAILFGITMLFAAATELFAAFASHGWPRAGRLALGVALGVIGIVSFTHPGNTFRALAALMSFAFIFKGIFDLVIGIAGRHGERWLSIVLGVIELMLGVWAAGDFGNRALLLVIWIGVTALMRGVSEIIFAFSLRSGAAD